MPAGGEATVRLRLFHEDEAPEEPLGKGFQALFRQRIEEADAFYDDRLPAHGDDSRFAGDPHWRDLVLFHEYFHGDTGRGLGAPHQTGWTALVTRCLERLARRDTAP